MVCKVVWFGASRADPIADDRDTGRARGVLRRASPSTGPLRGAGGGRFGSPARAVRSRSTQHTAQAHAVGASHTDTWSSRNIILYLDGRGS